MRRAPFLAPALILGLLAFSAAARAEIVRRTYASSRGQLRLEVLDDGLLHFEWRPRGAGTQGDDPIPVSPLVAQTHFPGATLRGRSAPVTRLRTSAMVIDVDRATLCFSLSLFHAKSRLTLLCPAPTADGLGLTIARDDTRQLYGLGEQFRTPGQMDGDWIGAVREPGDERYGNKMVAFNGGANGNLQMPLLYAMGPEHASYALFLDDSHRQRWDFSASPWKVQTGSPILRGFLFAGQSLPDLRHAYLNLVGKPLVPPRKLFGLWLSQYGYRDWKEIEEKLGGLRAQHFPIDGFMLDLFWFGGIATDSDTTRMGSLSWDPTHFPQAGAKIRELRERSGVGVIPIEESYVGRDLPEHADLESRGFLVKDASGKAAYLTHHSWWGRGGMIDWTNPQASDYRHKTKRVRLLEDGVEGFWIDLGEPEIFPADGRYFADRREPDVHNLYNFDWIRGIYEGYQRYSPDRRPFLLSRSGGAGMQRYGAWLWSGDIATRLSSLAAHQNAQMQLSLCGIDYYGADIGGFHREAIQGNLDEIYTQWLATASLFDVPVRPHAEDLCRCRQTSPDRIGEPASNLANLRLRYRLIPYLYSLAHRAHLDGDPVFPPLVYAFESDPAVRQLASEKLIGPFLLGAAVARDGQQTADVYLPRGTWYDFHTDTAYESPGTTLKNVALRRDGIFQAPLYARAGAIVPVAQVDDRTWNALGQRADGPPDTTLALQIYPDATPSAFTLFEDDGESTAYLKGGLRRTEIRQKTEGKTVTIAIGAAQGTYTDAPTARAIVIALVTGGTAVAGISADGRNLAQREPGFPGEGWSRASVNRITIRTASHPVTAAQTITVRLR
jgi:alpha-glucosidase